MVCNLAVERLGHSSATRATVPLDKAPRLGGTRPVSRGREQAQRSGPGVWFTPRLVFVVRGTVNRTALDRLGIYSHAKSPKVGHLGRADRNVAARVHRIMGEYSILDQFLKM